MMLSDVDIQAAMARNDIAISNLNNDDIQPASVDLHLSNEFAIFGGGHNKIVEIKGNEVLNVPEMLASKQQNLVLLPSQFALASTKEKISIGPSIGARIEGRSTIGRLGLAVHITAGFIDPGFEGNITLELFNHSPNRICIWEGAMICQISFYQLSSPCEWPYGAKGKSKYQGQRGVTPAKTRS